MSDRDAKLEKELLTLEEAKSEMLSKTFGEDKAKKIDEIRTKLAKSVFEARKNQVETQKATYAERKEILKNVENFWPLTLQKSTIAQELEEDDLEALSHITDLTVEYSSEDPRDYSVIFTFDGKNPYFKETELKKSFTVHEAIKKSTPYDLDAPVFTEKVAISWTDDKHNLVKKSPKPDMSKMEEYDDFNSLGSFFNFFTSEDDDGLGERLQQVYESAIDIFAGIEELGESSDDEEEDSEDDADEVDLGDSETDMPKKKKSKKN